MENKRQIIAKKIDNFVFNAKHLNIIISVFLVIFIIFFSICYSKERAFINTQNETYQRLIDQINEHQLNVIYTNVTPNVGTADESKDAEEPIFKDAKQAIVYAFNKFNNYKSYEMVSTGMNYSEAMGQTVEIKNNGLFVKYEDGLEYERSCRIETKTSFGQSGAEENVYKDSKKYQRKGTNYRLEENKATADFSGSFSQISSNLKSLPYHIVNEETVIFKNSFTFVRDINNKILYYKASVSLDPEKSTIYFGENVKEQGGTYFPVFSKVELSCIIDKDGNLMSFEFNDTMTVTKKVLINVDAYTTSSVVYTLISHDKTPSITKPQI